MGMTLDTVVQSALLESDNMDSSIDGATYWSCDSAAISSTSAPRFKERDHNKHPPPCV